MAVEGIIRFLALEAILALIILLAFWGIPKIITDGRASMIVKAIVAVIVGAAMLILLIRFVGVI